MTPPPPSDLAAQLTLGDTPIPDVVVRLAGPHVPKLAWKNELGGLTFRIGERFIKWNPHGNGVELTIERERLEWLTGRHPAPRVREHGEDACGAWLITDALPGQSAVSAAWRARPVEAIRAIAHGLRALHAVDAREYPERWSQSSWAARAPSDLGPRPAVVDPVLVHGDACAPNTLIAPDGSWAGHVDVGALAVGDRWADLAIAAMSLGWNFGEGHEAAFLDAYGIEPDAARMTYYRALWDRES